MRGKNGQFFILAAVIISSIVLSIGATSNYALINEDSKDYEGFSSELKGETGEVVDYSIFSGFTDDEKLEDFINLLSVYVEDKESDSSFMFIYGDENSITIENHGIETADISTEGESASAVAGGKKIKSEIKIAGTKQDFYGSYDSHGGKGSKVVLDNNGKGFSSGSKIEVIISNRHFDFPISKNKQIIFFIQKEEGNEVYIAAK